MKLHTKCSLLFLSVHYHEVLSRNKMEKNGIDISYFSDAVITHCEQKSMLQKKEFIWAYSSRKLLVPRGGHGGQSKLKAHILNYKQKKKAN